jgi:hypothetical protein
METIIIRRADTCYTATFTDAAVRDLFGTDTLPTAYGVGDDPDFVRQEIERLNPTCDVLMR